MREERIIDPSRLDTEVRELGLLMNYDVLDLRESGRWTVYANVEPDKGNSQKWFYTLPFYYGDFVEELFQDLDGSFWDRNMDLFKDVRTDHALELMGSMARNSNDVAKDIGKRTANWIAIKFFHPNLNEAKCPKHDILDSWDAVVEGWKLAHRSTVGPVFHNGRNWNLLRP